MKPLKLILALVFVSCSSGTNTRNSNDDLGYQYPGIDTGSSLDATVFSDTPVSPPDDGDTASSDAKSSDEDTGSLDAGQGQSVDAGSVDDGLPPPNGVPQFSHCTEKGGSRNIYDLQDPQCPDHISPAPTEQPGIDVVLDDVIVTAVYGDTVFVQEAPGGPYSGIAIFAHGIPTSKVALGDVLRVEGNYMEFFENTQIYLTQWEVKGSGDVPQPFLPSHPAHIATGGEMAEMMEGVLVRVSNVETIHTKPDCPQDWKEFLVTGDLRIDDKGYFWDARLGDKFESITGPMTYDFGNFKLLPRIESDVVVTDKGAKGSTSKCIESDCIVPASAGGTKEVIVNEIMPDPLGGDAGFEWIELYNTTSGDISIDGWELRDCGGQKVPLVGANLTVPAKGHLVLGMNGNQSSNGGVDIAFAYGDAFYLPNTVGSVLLFDGSGVQANVIDQARYQAFEPWTVVKAGASIERIKPTSDGTLPESWKTGSGTYGPTENQGSPGK